MEVKGLGVGLTMLEKGHRDKAKQDSEYDIEFRIYPAGTVLR